MRRSSILAIILAVLCIRIDVFAAASADLNTAPLAKQTPMLDRSKVESAVAAQAPQMFKIHAGVSQGYILGPGDVMAITDTSEEKPTVQTVPILPDGTCVTSYTGVITAAGLNMTQMNELINERAKKWYVNPQLMVNLARQRATQVYLLGDVFHPGLYSMGGGDAGMTPSDGGSGDDGGGSGGSVGGLTGATTSTTFTLSAVLQMSGGLRETADVRHLRVTRLAPKQTFQIDLWKLMIDGDVSEDILLQPGDVVYVPKGGAEYDPEDLGKLAMGTKKVRVLGAVKTPGLQSMSNDDDLMNVIVKAGGFADTASQRFIILARTNRDGTVTTEKIRWKKGMTDGHAEIRTKVHAGDIVMVKNSKTKTVVNKVGAMAPYMLMYGLMYVVMNRLNSSNGN